MEVLYTLGIYSGTYFKESSTTDFTNNTAIIYGGAIYTLNSSVSFEDNSTIQILLITLLHYGGAIFYDNIVI